MAPSFSGAGVARAAKRGHGAALELPAGPRPLLAAAAAAAAAPRESNPLRWGPPPLEPVPDAGPRDSVFAAAASEDEPMAEADAPARALVGYQEYQLKTQTDAEFNMKCVSRCFPHCVFMR